jgi:thioredoxin 1
MNIDLNSFRQEVLNADKPVLLDFWAPWCGPCRMVVPIVDEIAAERPDVLVGKVNIDEQFDLAREFDVTTIPTLVVLKEGKVVRRATGARPKAQILALLED